MAAGLGFKEFTTGDVLTAADANGYLASQVVMVFADAAARTSAIASPQEGMISYLKDTNSTEYYSGSAWVAVGSIAAGPAFRAYRTTNQTPTNNAYTKIQFNTESFDTNSNYDPTTNFRFTPTTAGYYQITVRLVLANVASTAYSSIYKNGSAYSTNGQSTGTVESTDLVYLNGSTDYVEAYCYNESNASVFGSITSSYFSGFWVRG
jgi:hypothetical protein